MKKILKISLISASIFLTSLVALGAPTYRLERTLLPELTSTYELGTSTKAWLRVTSNIFCLTADTCITAWPTGGGGTWGSITGTLSDQTDLQTVLDTFVTGATDSTLTKTATTLGINLANANTWTGQQTFTTNSLEVGVAGTGNNLNTYSTLGSTLIPALTTGNWSLGTGWTYGTSPDRIIKSSNGTGLLTQTGGTAPTIGTLYKVTITVTGLTVGSFTWTLGARSGGGIISADGTYTYFVEAFNTNRFIVTPTNTSRFTLSAISVQAVTLGTVTAQGNVVGSRVTSPSFESTIPYGTPVDTARMSFYAKDGNAGYPDNNTVWYDWNVDLNGTKYQLMKLYAVDATTWGLQGAFFIAPSNIKSSAGNGGAIGIQYGYLSFNQAGNSTWLDLKKVDTNSGFNLTSSMSNGATAWGYDFDTLNAFSTAGAVIARFKTGGTIKASIDKDGTYNGVGFTGTGLITNRLTTKQQQWEYDASNYANITVGSTGGVTLDAVGSGAKFNFSDYVGIGTSTPSALLAINPVAGDINAFNIGSSTAQLFNINTKGQITTASTTSGLLTLASGTATKTGVPIDSNSIILLTLQNCSTCGTPYISATSSTSFTVLSTNILDASSVGYQIIQKQ